MILMVFRHQRVQNYCMNFSRTFDLFFFTLCYCYEYFKMNCLLFTFLLNKFIIFEKNGNIAGSAGSFENYFGRFVKHETFAIFSIVFYCTFNIQFILRNNTKHFITAHKKILFSHTAKGNSMKFFLSYRKKKRKQ